MKTKKRFFRLAFMGLIFTTSFVMGKGDTLSGNILWKVNSAKTDVFQGEPFVLTLGITNKTNKPVSVELGSDGIRVFSMEIRTMTDKLVKSGTAIYSSGVSRIHRLPIFAHSENEVDLVVNRWVSTDVPPGKYKLVCFVNCSSGQSLALEHKFNILQANKENLMSIFSELADKVISDTSPRERSIASRMLAFANSPLSVNQNMRVAKQENLDLAIRMRAIESFGRIACEASARHIVALFEDDDLPDELRATAIITAYYIADKGDNKLKSIVNPVIEKHKRPPRVFD